MDEDVTVLQASSSHELIAFPSESGSQHFRTTHPIPLWDEHPSTTFGKGRWPPPPEAPRPLTTEAPTFPSTPSHLNKNTRHQATTKTPLRSAERKGRGTNPRQGAPAGMAPTCGPGSERGRGRQGTALGEGGEDEEDGGALPSSARPLFPPLSRSRHFARPGQALGPRWLREMAPDSGPGTGA